MEHNRIQKLLLSEYCDFSDTVLLESPFAETTRDGRGLREVALGLTPSRLVVAADIFNEHSDFICPPGLDPSIESFELVSVFPLECVSLSVFRRRHRRTIKARLVNGRVNYYELGGMERRGMFWGLWCERVRSLIAEKLTSSSLSETTAGTSSSSSTLYLLSSGVEVNDAASRRPRGEKAMCRVWAHYGGAGDAVTPSWPRKDLYLGPSYDELGHGYYTPVPIRFAGASLEDLKHELNDRTPSIGISRRQCCSWPVCQSFQCAGQDQRSAGLCDVLFTRDKSLRLRGLSFTGGASSSPSRNANEAGNRPNGGQRDAKNMTLAPKLSRFGFGVDEHCGSGLYLGPRSGDGALRPAYTLLDPYKLIEGGVSVWEGGTGEARGRGRSSAVRHPRRYAMAGAAHFLHALGPWSVQPGERQSVQGRRALSTVCVRRQAPDPELRLPVSRRQLAASVSASALEPGRGGAMGAATRGRVVLFWTPEYWYRPRAATAAYKELRRHLALLRDFRLEKEKTSKKKFFCRRKCSVQSEGGDLAMAEDRPGCILGRIFSVNGAGGGTGPGQAQARKRRKGQDHKEAGNSTTSQLRRLLRMDLRVSVWDLDSTTISKQLTLIDRELFLRIPSLEIEILVYQKSSRNAPNLGAWIAFSHRISCLTTSEILAAKQTQTRARLLARLINAADKCHGTGNFHSCRSILAGLQSPPIYRLRATWAYLRTHHATKYQTMEGLCKIYRNPRTAKYQKAWARVERGPPFMPYVGDLLARLLGLNEKKTSCYRSGTKLTSSPGSNSRCSAAEEASRQTLQRMDALSRAGTKQGLARRFLSAAILRLGRGRRISSPGSRGKNEAWTSRQRLVAKLAWERWRNLVFVSRTIAENENRLRLMDSRKKRVLEVASWLVDCQRAAQNYAYPGHSLAWEFLLKARYKEDRENFFISLKLEPPRS